MRSASGRPRSSAAKIGQLFELDLRMQLVDAEERCRPGLRAFRDPQRPAVWDRQLVIPEGPPTDVGQDLAALDRYYQEVGAPQYSFVFLANGPWAMWRPALDDAGCDGEAAVLMVQPTRPGKPVPQVLVLDGPDRYQRLLVARRRMTTEPSMSPVLADLVDLLVLRARHGFEPIILGYEHAGEIVAYMYFTVVDGVSWMEDLETRVDCRGRGFGTALLAAAQVEAARRGAQRSAYYADADDWPWRWYERLGWREVGRALRHRRRLR